MKDLTAASKAYLVFVFVILYAPILYLIFYSFNSAGNMNNFESFSLEHYQAVFEDSRLIIVLLNTVLVALLSGLIATILGTLGAIGIVSVKNKKNAQYIIILK